MHMAEIRGAVARGWCDPNTEHLEMDSELAECISQEIGRLFEKEGRKVYLGYATTRQLLEELHARIEVAGDLDYSTMGIRKLVG